MGKGQRVHDQLKGTENIMNTFKGLESLTKTAEILNQSIEKPKD